MCLSSCVRSCFENLLVFPVCTRWTYAHACLALSRNVHTPFTPFSSHLSCSVVESKTQQFNCSPNANTSYPVFKNNHTSKKAHTTDFGGGNSRCCLLCDISRKHAIKMHACTDTSLHKVWLCNPVYMCVLWLRIKGEMPVCTVHAGATVASLRTLKSTVLCLEMDMWIAIWAVDLGKLLFTAFTVH